ncbi:TetR/AcrR family transcriptional regulator [Nocardia sp. NPDC020380]|uniref:TetR/AcrR family transcriptional regulator n=1 Tax=Nocardia sp. NPDC020380 TaxID=3364309 RepID=UPI0037A56731
MRRTQQERREATITKLFDAAIATIDELGYAKASASTITARAGMSYGALFRHFPTMSDFMAAVARETMRRHSELVTARFQALTGSTAPGGLATLLTAMHELVTHPTRYAILELTVAARTDEQLRNAMRATTEEAGLAIVDTADRMVGSEFALGPAEFTSLVFLVLDLFDNEAIQHPLRVLHPEIYDHRLPLLLRMVEPLLARDRRSLDTPSSPALPDGRAELQA